MHTSLETAKPASILSVQGVQGGAERKVGFRADVLLFANDEVPLPMNEYHANHQPLLKLCWEMLDKTLRLF